MSLFARSSLLPETQADLRNRPRSTLYRARIGQSYRLIKLAKVILCLLVYTIFVFYFDLILETFASTIPHPVNWFPAHTPFPVEAATNIEHNPRVLILQYQHVDYRWGHLFQASVKNHQDYARAWGYSHKVDQLPYVIERIGRWNTKAYMNKIHALQRAALEEISKGDQGAEWIWLTDVDTFITNPAIAIQDLLPPSSFTPKPLILGNQDHNGFNAGVMLFHVERLLVEFSEKVLQLEKQYTIPWWFAPTDQHLICDVLKEDPVISNRFYEIPQAWLNIYFLPNNVADAENEEEEPHLQVHLVRGVKKKLSHGKLLEAADEVYKLGKEKAMQIGDPGNGLEALGQRSKTKRFAEKWWKEHRGGVEGIKFNDF